MKCPVCGHVFDITDMTEHVTYWGEESAKEDECPACEAALLVKEDVTREFTVTLNPDNPVHPVKKPEQDECERG